MSIVADNLAIQLIITGISREQGVGPTLIAMLVGVDLDPRCLLHPAEKGMP